MSTLACKTETRMQFPKIPSLLEISPTVQIAFVVEPKQLNIFPQINVDYTLRHYRITSILKLV